ncbi:glycosyltransferase family 8 protein [bacterium]|nr:glycosyltransferase family 8 protein [bacterium]
MLQLKSGLPVVDPVFPSGSVNICFATDQNYLPFLAVTILSLRDHADPHCNYDICILNDGQLDTSRFPFDKLQTDHFKIRFLTMDLKKYPYDFSTHLSGYYTIATYYRFFIGEIFRRFDKILYLDTDMIAMSDPQELFALPLDDKIFAGGTDRCHFLPIEDNWRSYVATTLGIPLAQYFCAGIMLMNIAKMRAAQLLIRSLQKLDELGTPQLVDQDVLNSLFADKTLVLPPCWNVMWSVFLQGSKREQTLYKKQALPAKIIHYDSKVKPWNTPSAYLADHWWYYARQLGLTPKKLTWD